jgi:hypothetical protein
MFSLQNVGAKGTGMVDISEILNDFKITLNKSYTIWNSRDINATVLNKNVIICNRVI